MKTNSPIAIYSEIESSYYKKQIKEAITDFMNYTESEDYIGIILRAQIYIETDIDILLNNLLIHPNKISLQFFSAKLDAAYALGGIDDEWYHALKNFNKLRNKCAHDFKFEFTENDYNSLISTLSKDAKNNFLINLQHEELINTILSMFNDNPSQPLSLKYKLRVLLSDFMLYMMQQHQSILYLWKEISLTKEAQIIKERKLLIEELTTNNNK